MTLAIDMIGTRLGSGTRTYNLNFCEHLNKIKLNEKINIFITKDYFNNISNTQNSNITYIVKSTLLTNTFLRIIWMQFFLPFELKKLKVSQLYSPMNIGPIFLRLFNIKFTLALHSNLPWVYFFKMPGNLFRNTFTKFMMQFSILACDSLIVDSEFAKNEIVALLKINRNKVFVIYLGIDQKYLNTEKDDHYLKDFEYKNYFISVLSCVKYHNIINLLKAFKLLKEDKTSNIKFILVLQILDIKYFREINKYILNNFNKNEIILFHNLESKYLVNLYNKATFYIFSSYCEVFGLTSLEAMSQKCPILISNRSAIPEINGDAAEYFDPDNTEQIKESMNKILSNEQYRKELINKGITHFKKFSWKKTVQETITVLNI